MADAVPGSIVYFSVANPVYKVDVSMMHNVFSKHGTPSKLFIFTKDGSTQGFCQLATAEEAAEAVASLNGRAIFEGGANRLTVRTTDRPGLQVRYNNETSWDYHNNLPTGPDPSEKGAKGAMKGVGKGDRGAMMTPTARFDPYPSNGKGLGMKGMPHYGGGKGGMMPGGKGQKGGACTPVLLVNSIPTVTDAEGRKLVTTDSLFVLFGCYADVIRVLFLKSPNQALVECANIDQAECARQHLDNVTFYGTTVRVYGASNPHITVREDQQMDVQKFWDYTGSHLHRFINPKSYDNITEPKPTLVVWGYPENYTDAELIPMFANYGTVESFRNAPMGASGKMALIQLESTDQAIVCLLNLHDIPLEGTAVAEGERRRNLRLNFAKENLHCPSAHSKQVDDKLNVMVRNLPADFDDNSLRALMQAYGTVTRCTIWRDRITKESKGFGLVEYKSPEEVEEAIANLHESQVLPGAPGPLQVVSKYHTPQ